MNTTPDLNADFRPLLESGHLQAHNFRLALLEVGVSSLNAAKINHKTGQCFHPSVGLRGLIFPKSMVQVAKAMLTEKTEDYYFSGAITSNRIWVLHYPNTKHSNRGRDPSRKYTYDKNYFSELGRVKFGLAPVGNCPWSYRFFESVMCGAIPVIGDVDHDVYADNFNFFRHSDLKFYSKSIAAVNYHRLLTKHTL